MKIIGLKVETIFSSFFLAYFRKANETNSVKK